MCWKSSPLCSETRLDRKIHFGSAHLNVLAVLCFSGFCYFCCCCFLSLQTPEALVSAGHARSAEEKKKDSNELEALRQKEHAEKHSRTLQRGARCRHTDVLQCQVYRCQLQKSLNAHRFSSGDGPEVLGKQGLQLEPLIFSVKITSLLQFGTVYNNVYYIRSICELGILLGEVQLQKSCSKKQFHGKSQHSIKTHGGVATSWFRMSADGWINVIICLQKCSQKHYSILSTETQCICCCFPLRHSRFGGSFVVQGLKAIGDKDVIYHRNLQNVSCSISVMKSFH